MDWSSLDAFIRTQFEPLQYLAFFGALVVFGALEAFVSPGQEGIERRSRWPANVGLTVLNILVTGAMPVGVVAAADYAVRQGWGLLHQPYVPAVAALVLGIVLRSLISYGTHVAMHKVPLFWRVHRVHHTDTQMDVSTTVRFHPLEFVISTPILLALTIAFGLPPVAAMLYELFDAAMAVFTHANIRLPGWLERAIGSVLVTPDMHRIHHSAWQPETDSNYGVTFSWWDRMFGTYRTRPADELDTMQIGLEWRDQRTNSLKWLLWMPFITSKVRVAKRAIPARGPQGESAGEPA